LTVHRQRGKPDNEGSQSPRLACGSVDDVDPIARAQMKGQLPLVLWFTGLSGSGKSTLARLVERKLAAEGRHTTLLDGDHLRQGLNKDLGFTDADRTENIRRVGEVSKLFVDAGLIVLVSCISPFRSDRDHARKLVGEGQFVEIFVDTPLDVCIARDPKGLYRKAIAGEIKNIAGIDTAYEAPAIAEIVLKTTDAPATVLAEQVLLYLKNRATVG
jgi:bifunctional enzyme CysN/CysC